MAANERHMLPDRVRAMGNDFDRMSKVLKAIIAVMEVQIMLLKASAFVSMGSSLVLERFLSMLKPRMETLQKNCADLAQDAILSAADWEKAAAAN